MMAKCCQLDSKKISTPLTIVASSKEIRIVRLRVESLSTLNYGAKIFTEYINEEEVFNQTFRLHNFWYALVAGY